MAVQLRSALIVLLLCVSVVNGEDIFKGIEDSYGLMDPERYTITDYYDSGWNRTMSGTLFSKCCCRDRIRRLAENNVAYIVGGYIAKAVDNTAISIESLRKSTAFYDKLIHNLERYLQLKANYKNSTWYGTIYQTREESFYQGVTNSALCTTANAVFGEIDKSVTTYLLQGAGQ